MRSSWPPSFGRAPGSATAAAGGGGGGGGVEDAAGAEQNGYGLVLLDRILEHPDQRSLSDLVSMLDDISRDQHLVWEMCPRTESLLKKHHLYDLVSAGRITRIERQPYGDHVRWMSHAGCVLTDSWLVQEESTALGIPCLTLGSGTALGVTVLAGSNTFVGSNRTQATRILWDCIFNGGKRGRSPRLWDGKTGSRVAAYLSAWLSGIEHGATNVTNQDIAPHRARA